ncbi:MAG: phosphatidate cytidylyltransferase [Frankiaceae bacterium]
MSIPPTAAGAGEGTPTGEPTSRAEAPARRSRAGRDLPAAIGVGVGLGALVIVTLFLARPVWIGVAAVGLVMGTFEVVRALHRLGLRPPMLPLLAGAAAMTAAGYVWGAEALVLTLFVTVVVSGLWRAFGGPGDVLRDTSSATYSAIYVGFLGGFAALLSMPPDGPRRVLAFIATVVCSDVGGYAAGVLFGKHPMAPTISPKKSWEGFAGSAVCCMLAGALFLSLSLHEAVWKGILFGAALVCTATLGDLCESLIKRDIGIKDMGTLLPGHGGIMDRLDSLLVSAPVAWLLLTGLAPP